MAEFGAQATQLSGPQGSGANVVNPVQIAPTESRDIPAIGMGLVSSVVDVFNKGMVETRKADAEKRKNTVVNAYIQQEAAINDAVESGQMSPSEAAARSRSNFNKNAASHGEFIEDFEKAGRALRGFTAKGESEKKVETLEKRREADIAEAQKRGFTFPPGMSGKAEDAQIEAAKTSIRAEADLAAMYKRNAEARAQGTFDQSVAAKEEKDLGIKLINDIAGSNIGAFQEFVKTTGDNVRNGTMTPEMAKVTLNERYVNINAAIQAAARTNPELAAPYRTLFDSINKIGVEMIDPKTNLEDAQNRLALIQTQMKLVAMANPKIAAAVVANQLLPNNASLALSSAPEGVNAIAILSSIPVGDKTYTPRVVGNPDVEEGALKLLKQGLNDLKGGKVRDKEIATLQASNSVNHILKQTGNMLSEGAEPKQLKGVAAFCASPDYAGFVSVGSIDRDAAQACKITFQQLYEPAIIQGVQTKMTETLARGLDEGGGASKVKAPAPTTVADSVDIKFSGSGILFETRAKTGLVPSELRSQRAVVESLRSSQQGINQIIHIAAHLEGSTDYNKFWEENKHKWVPGYFMKGLKEGDVRNGYKYLGGNASSESSWRKASDGTSK